MRRTIAFTLFFALLLSACSGSDGDAGDTSAPAPAPAATADAATDASETEASGASDESASNEGSGGCPAAPFDGVILRGPDPDNGHGEGAYGATDFSHSKAVSIGANDYTTYISSSEIGGGTVTAEPGGVVVTLFVQGGDTELAPGVQLPINIGAIVDNSGSAAATTTGFEGQLTIIDATDDRLCFTVAYGDDLQGITGTFSVEF